MIVLYRSSRFLLYVLDSFDSGVGMKKTKLAILLSTILIISVTCFHAFCESPDAISPGPAPNSGDGEPDGSGFSHEECPNPDSPAKGPAPNSGDGIPDGSGF